MTTCIAALAAGGAHCVLISDQMTTAHFPIGYEFETEEVQKIVDLADGAYAMISGDVVVAHMVIEETRRQLQSARPADTRALGEVVRKAYQAARQEIIVNTQLEPRGLDLASYYGSQMTLLPPIVQIIDQQLVTFDLGVDIVVAGEDDQGWHIYTVQNPGVCYCHDPVGYTAIGSGAPHAIYSLIEAGYRKSMSAEKVRQLVELAKMRSEVAPGVGEQSRVLTTNPEMSGAASEPGEADEEQESV
jgi:20S proteasome alpha/beta subunit